MNDHITFVTKKVHAPMGNHYFDAVLICIRNDDTGAFAVHPVTAFLREEYFDGNSAETMKQIAAYICHFLNWYKDVALKDDLRDMTIDDISVYLNEEALSKYMKRKSLDHKKSFLMRFLYYLVKKEVVTSVHKNDLYTPRVFRGRTVLQNHVKLTVPQSQLKPDNVVKVKTIEAKYFIPFMNAAVKTCPEIAFGILLSFTGGLRAGEVVNLDKSAYTCLGPYGVDGFILDVRKRDLRKDCQVGNVKRTRMQKTIPAGAIAKDILEMHLKYYTSPDCDALFINENGLPMTVESYRNRFNRVKEAFIKDLKDNDDFAAYSYALYLESTPWSTHIGRGFFSNTIAKVTGNDPGMLAACRGDRDPTSSLVYLDGETIKAASQVLNRWYQKELGDDY